MPCCPRFARMRPTRSRSLGIMRGRLAAAQSSPASAKLSGLKIQQRSAAPEIGRHRDLVVRDEPVAVDLAEAGRVPNPGTDPVPVLRRAAEPIEAVPECHVIAHGDREVANLVTERRLEYR